MGELHLFKMGILIVILLACPSVRGEQSAPIASAEDSEDLLTEQVRVLAAASRPAKETLYALQRAWDLILLDMVRHPDHGSASLLTGKGAATLRALDSEIAQTEDPIVRGLHAGLLGRYSEARVAFGQAPVESFCGNAATALEFGRAEFLMEADFLSGNLQSAMHSEVAYADPKGLLWLDVHSSRWSIVFAVLAAVHERLGHGDLAQDFACRAMDRAQHPESSWSYYYSPDDRMWSIVRESIATTTRRLGANCDQGKRAG